jgi:NADPH-dependent ferric siderophore reductase
MAPLSERATAIAARLEGAVALDLSVAETFEVAKGIRELTLEGDLASFSPWPGQDVMISVPPGDDAARWRRYTVRRIDPASSTIDLWVTVDTNGPGATWAGAAAAGDRVEAVGPRGKIALDAGAPTHLFVVDPSGIAAMCAMAEALVAPALVVTIVGMPQFSGFADTEAVAPLCADGVQLRHHVLQDDTGPAWLDQVLDAMIKPIEDTPIATYVFGELEMTRRVVAGLPDRGIDPSWIRSKPYWRNDKANESNGEPMREGAPDSE